MNEVPCKNCEERSAICHAQCYKYHAWVKERKELLERKQKSGVVKGYIYDCGVKLKRWRGKD